MGPSLAELHPQLRPYAEYAVNYFRLLTGGKQDPATGRVTGGIVPTITSVYRSHQKQLQLYQQRAKNPYPVNRPGDSAHQYALAWDSDVPDAYMPLWIEVRRAVGWRVPENDEVHAELPEWRNYVTPRP